MAKLWLIAALKRVYSPLGAVAEGWKEFWDDLDGQNLHVGDGAT